MNVHPGSFWVHQRTTHPPGPSLLHIVLEHYDSHVVTWAVKYPTPVGLALHDNDDFCESWYGPTQDFFKEFKPLQG